MGMSVSRELGGGQFSLTPDEAEEMRQRLEVILQNLIEG
jgi:hypothetical protein